MNEVNDMKNKKTIVEEPSTENNAIEQSAKQNNNKNSRSSSANSSDLTNRTSSINTENTIISDSEYSKIHSFGWGKFQPKFLQRFCSVKWALFWFCWAGALQGFIVNGFVNVVITTIERRFGLSSTQTGLVASAYDIASFFCLVPISYFGGRKFASKPKYLAWGVVLMGVGSLVFALPHFLVGVYSGTLTDETHLCKANENNFELKSENTHQTSIEDLTWAIWFFFGGQFLIGAGATPLFTLGVAYIDENVSKKMSSVYLGIYYTMAIIGPAVGYIIGGQLLLINTDFLSIDSSEIGLTSDSNVWIGAWWIGFILGAILCFLLAIPMFGYPKTLPGIEKLRTEKNTEAYNDGKNAEQEKSYTTLKELPNALWVLLRNPTFFFLNLSAAADGLLVGGFSAFLPKLIENQYSISPVYTAILVGVITVPAGGGGTFLGGYFVKKFKLTCTGIIKTCICFSLIATILSTEFVLSCPNLPFAGVTVSYSDNVEPAEANVDLSLKAPCNADCNCSSNNYEPICGMDKVMYYNPCFAGCQEMKTLNETKFYRNCSCVHQIQTVASLPEATNTICESSCHHLPYFAAFTFVLMFFTFLASMPSLSATLRCVNEDQRSFALGIQWMKVRIFGTIPAPIIFGALIDQTCALWHKDSGDDISGACLIYNNQSMSWNMFILAISGKIAVLLLFILAWIFYKSCSPAILKANHVTDNHLEKTNDNKIDGK